MHNKPTTREAALDLIANTFCEGSSGTVGGTLAEDILKNLEAGGFSFATAAKTPDPDHKETRSEAAARHKLERDN